MISQPVYQSGRFSDFIASLLSAIGFHNKVVPGWLCLYMHTRIRRIEARVGKLLEKLRAGTYRAPKPRPPGPAPPMTPPRTPPRTPRARSRPSATRAPGCPRISPPSSPPMPACRAALPGWQAWATSPHYTGLLIDHPAPRPGDPRLRPSPVPRSPALCARFATCSASRATSCPITSSFPRARASRARPSPRAKTQEIHHLQILDAHRPDLRRAPAKIG